MTKGDVLSFLPGEPLSSRHTSTAPGGWPSDRTSFFRLQVEDTVRASRGQHLANQLDGFPRCSAEVCPAWVRLGGSDHLIPWLWAVVQLPPPLHQQEGPSSPAGSQCTARSWKGPRGPVSIPAQDCLVCRQLKLSLEATLAFLAVGVPPWARDP